MAIKEFQLEHKNFCYRYNEMLDLYYRCSDYIENVGRTKKEIEKYLKMLVLYTNKLSILMQEYKSITKEELPNRLVLGGFIFYEVQQ